MAQPESLRAVFTALWRKLSCLLTVHLLHITEDHWNTGQSTLTCKECGHQEPMQGEILAEFLRYNPIRRARSLHSERGAQP